jgi:hypothetical protein
MAVNAFTFQDLYTAVSRIVYNTNDPGPEDLAECQRIVNEAVLDHYSRHDWTYLSPLASIVLWTDIAVGTPTVSADSTTMTASTASFYESMIGSTITVTGIGTRTITGYTSSTVLTIDSTFAGSHTFSFTADGVYGLPDDFGALVERFSWKGELGYRALELTTTQHIGDLKSIEDDASGEPVWASIVPRVNTSTKGQRWDLEVWPVPQTLRTFRYRYRRDPQTMTGDAEYPWGGPPHATAILSAVKAKGEQEKNQVRGPWTEQYEKVDLPLAIQRDLDMRPRNLGENLDPDLVQNNPIRMGVWTHSGST